jgi:hypothetical protein
MYLEQRNSLRPERIPLRHTQGCLVAGRFPLMLFLCSICAPLQKKVDLCICVCVCVYVCMYVCMYVHMGNVCVCVCVREVLCSICAPLQMRFDLC